MYTAHYQYFFFCLFRLLCPEGFRRLKQLALCVLELSLLSV